LPGSFWGYEQELCRIVSTLVSPTRSARSIIAIIGPEGSGKTTLLREAVSRAERLGFRLASPYGHGGEPAGRAPTLVTVDDAHRVEPAALRRILTGARAPGSPRTVWILAGRPGPDRATAGWPQPDPDDEVTTIHLAGLTEDATRALVAEMAGAPPSTQLAALAGQAAGNPRLIRELVAGLADDGGLRVLAGEAHVLDDWIPRRLDVLVRSRLIPVSVHPPAEAGRCECTRRARSSAWDSLNDTEVTIAHLVSSGLTNQQIATRVSLSPHTVNYYLRRIFRKLNVASRVELATLVCGQRQAG
jgi:DNA-binding CsgD family transcriptional regulator